MPEIYQPEEDSYLMSEALNQTVPNLLGSNPKLIFLEIGSGSGINLQTVKQLGIKIKNIISADINPKAVKHCKSLGFNCVKSNLFSKIPKKKFDIIIFNPPYLPEDSNEPEDSKIATTGGKLGNELSIKFLRQAKNFLSKSGRILLITSSLAKEIPFQKLGYKSRLVKSKKIFFEELLLWEILL